MFLETFPVYSRVLVVLARCRQSGRSGLQLSIISKMTLFSSDDSQTNLPLSKCCSCDSHVVIIWIAFTRTKISIGFRCRFLTLWTMTNVSSNVNLLWFHFYISHAEMKWQARLAFNSLRVQRWYCQTRGDVMKPISPWKECVAHHFFIAVSFGHSFLRHVNGQSYGYRWNALNN